MPLPRKTMPKRLGKAEGGGTSAKAWRDSSQGKATVQPAPRSTARRDTGRARVLESLDMVHLCWLIVFQPDFFFRSPLRGWCCNASFPGRARLFSSHCDPPGKAYLRG